MRNPLLAALRRALQTALRISQDPRQIPVVEYIESLQDQAIKQREVAAQLEYSSRRQFLSRTIKAGAALSLGACLPLGCASTKRGQTAPRIAIVGAGIAGLNAAYRLQKAGYKAEVFEAAKRSGGRIFTGRNLLNEGQTTEIGGEFIDSNHSDMFDLAQTFGLTMLDVETDITTAGLQHDLFMPNGIKYTEAQAITELLPIAQKLIDHAAQLPSDINYQTSGKAKAFDLISIDEYFGKIGLRGWLKTLFEVAYVGEYGLDLGEQSALNFLTFFDPDTSDQHLKLFGDSDERYKIVGGNQQITDHLAQAIEPQIRYEYALTALQNKESGGYILSFANGKQFTADIVVLAVPFSIVRQIDMQISLPAIKQRVIQYLGYGTNSKYMLGTTQRPWRTQGQSGFLYTHQIHTGWDSSQGQRNNSGAGGYTVFLGGQSGFDLDKKRAELLNAGLNMAFDGFAQSLNGKAEVFNWAKYPYTKGSYSCYKVGQWTTLAGAESLPVGNLWFAGEHCSPSSAGFMNGGAESGRLVAEQLIAYLRGVI